MFFQHVETSMQFGSTEWVKITGNTNTIYVPPTEEQTPGLGSDEGQLLEQIAEEEPIPLAEEERQ